MSVMLAAEVPICADTFGTGDNQFTLEFVTISAGTNPAGGYSVVAYDYRIGKFEITANNGKNPVSTLPVY